MPRIRLQLQPGHYAQYRNLDLLHDALINAWTAAGIAAERVLGAEALPWNFAALGGHHKDGNHAHTLVIATPSRELAPYLDRLEPAQVRYARAKTAELVDFSSAERLEEPDPIPPVQGALGLLLLSPLAVRVPGSKRWYTDFRDFDLSAAINHRLSRVASREVRLQAEPDRLYLRANPKHSVLVPTKDYGNGARGFVIGLRAPLVLAGTEDDLRLAWTAGIGEKTRSGFGCLGLLERGVGR